MAKMDKDGMTPLGRKMTVTVEGSTRPIQITLRALGVEDGDILLVRLCDDHPTCDEVDRLGALLKKVVQSLGLTLVPVVLAPTNFDIERVGLKRAKQFIAMLQELVDRHERHVLTDTGSVP